MNANVSENPSIRMIELGTQEKSGLRRKITGHGNLKKAVELIGIDQNTIKRAIAGFNVKETTAVKIRNYLNPPPCTSPSSAASNQ